MGLDMYLHATKVFDTTASQAKILAAAEVKLDELKAMAGNDPYEAETSLWVSGYDFSGEDSVGKFKSIVTASGMAPLVDVETPSLSVEWRDGKVAVKVTAGYWRKANAIHAWFVDNVQDGIDECQESPPINVELLAALKGRCEEAIIKYDAGDLTGAGEVLQPRGGFFFGSTDIDQWWADDTKRTIALIDRVVRAAIEVKGVTFTYHSSW